MDEIKDTEIDRAALALILAGFSGAPDLATETDLAELNSLWSRSTLGLQDAGPDKVQEEMIRVSAVAAPGEVKARALDLLNLVLDFLLYPETIAASEQHG